MTSVSEHPDRRNGARTGPARGGDTARRRHERSATRGPRAPRPPSGVFDHPRLQHRQSLRRLRRQHRLRLDGLPAHRLHPPHGHRLCGERPAGSALRGFRGSPGGPATQEARRSARSPGPGRRRGNPGGTPRGGYPGNLDGPGPDLPELHRGGLYPPGQRRSHPAHRAPGFLPGGGLPVPIRLLHRGARGARLRGVGLGYGRSFGESSRISVPAWDSCGGIAWSA